jgi:ABC-type glutathione transport system ATPase component
MEIPGFGPRLAPGHTAALLATTGAGKSTIEELIARIRRPPFQRATSFSMAG